MPLPLLSPPSREERAFALLGVEEEEDSGVGRANDSAATWTSGSNPGSLGWFLERRERGESQEPQEKHPKSWSASNPGSLDWFLQRRGVPQATEGGAHAIAADEGAAGESGEHAQGEGGRGESGEGDDDGSGIGENAGGANDGAVDRSSCSWQIAPLVK
jgi:hypothetical protein